MNRNLEDIEDELDELQLSYIDEEDEFVQLEIERKFTQRLLEATKLDGIERMADGVTIHNWVRETSSEFT